MEIFLDGGLFELGIALAAGYFINFIFNRRFLLILFSLAVVAAPVILIFIRKSDLYYTLAAFSSVCSILFVVVLWQLRVREPGRPLFDLRKFRKDILRKKNSVTQ